MTAVLRRPNVNTVHETNIHTTVLTNSTTPTTLLPPWDYDGGRDAMMRVNVATTMAWARDDKNETNGMSKLKSHQTSAAGHASHRPASL